MLRHVHVEHSGFSYKCNICHKVLSRAQVHGTCPGRYRDTGLFHGETGARGWLGKQLFQQYKDNKSHQQWEERFKAPTPRPISPLPRTPPSTPPPTGRNCIVMTAIDSRKASTPEVQPRRSHLSRWKNKNKNWLTFSCLIRMRNRSVRTSRLEPRMSGFHHLLKLKRPLHHHPPLQNLKRNKQNQ